jgi:hypothetical protein
MSDLVKALSDGYQTLINFTGAGTIFEEISVQPPGMDNGAPIDITTMRRSALRGKMPRALREATDGEVTVAYDPTAYTTFATLIGLNQLITITFPDGGTRAFWGYAGSFVPDSLEEGKRPTAKIKLIETDTNGSGVETAPVETAATGSGW